MNGGQGLGSALNTRRCCAGSVSIRSTSWKPAGVHSLRTWSTDMRCGGEMWSAVWSSARYSTRATRPSGFRASRIFASIGFGFWNSW